VRGVHRAGLALAEGGGRRLLFAASDRDNERSVQWCEVDAYEDVPLNHTVRTGEPVVGSLDEIAQRYRGFAGRQTGETLALASLPIFAAGQVQGAYALYYDTRQRFDDGQVSELEGVGARLGADLRRVQRSTTHATRSLDAEPVPHGAQVATYLVAADPRAVGHARRFMVSTLAAWGIDEDSVDDAVLCVSELVTNAVLHTEAGCEVRAVLDRGVLTTTVRDGGSRVVVDPRHITVDPLAVHGRGLQLVDGCSTRWGSDLDAGGMSVWFVLEPATHATEPSRTQSTSRR
jgi:anti-sigma regulatory factor (Ser/Thr protein kinase)